MKICPNCQHAVDDDAAFCVTCGTAFAAPRQEQTPTPPQAPYTPPYAPPYVQQPAYDPYDHTAEFEAQDIADNKMVCMLVYLLDVVGVIIALLMAKDSAYTMFHIRQSLKFTVLEVLLVLAAVLLAITVVVPLAAAVCVVILMVLRVIGFFQVCSGKAKEAAIVRDIKFLK